MSDFLASYGLFFAKLTTLFILLVLFLIIIVAIISKTKHKETGKVAIKSLNEKFLEMQRCLQHAFLADKTFKKLSKEDHKNEKKKAEHGSERKKTYFLHFNGDIRASQVHELRELITAILLVATPEDEVVLALESGGGLIHSYGLAASQLQRLRDKDIPLTIVIDKVAASGGYMMACVANRILAAPFAIIGSIGVLLQMPNFHRFLKHNHIDFEQLSAGEFKRTLTIFGENTSKDRQKMQAELDEAHALFKAFIQQNRPHLDINHIATGEHWFGTRALELRLIDALSTSDDYLLELSKNSDIYELKYETKKTIVEKLGLVTTKIIDHITTKLAL